MCTSGPDSKWNSGPKVPLRCIFTKRDNELYQVSNSSRKILKTFTIRNFDDREKIKILDDEMFKDGDDDLSDLTSSEQSQLNDWYDNLSSKYDKVGNIIREVNQ